MIILNNFLDLLDIHSIALGLPNVYTKGNKPIALHLVLIKHSKLDVFCSDNDII